MSDFNYLHENDDVHICDTEDSPAQNCALDYPTLMLTLLTDDWLFFNDAEIVWNGEHHEIRGVQFNPQKKKDLLDFVNGNISGFISSSEIKDYLISFVKSVEDDDGLIVGRERISEDVRRFLRWGSLTGATLMNLVASDIEYRFLLQAEDDYEVVYDERLAKGIPQFYNLTARLIWDLRSCTKSQKGKAFTVRFLEVSDSKNNKNGGEQIQPVKDAQMPISEMQVDELPEISLHSTQKEDVLFTFNNDYSDRPEEYDERLNWEELRRKWQEQDRKKYRDEIRAKLLILKFCRTAIPSAYLKDAYDQQPDRDKYSEMPLNRLRALAESMFTKESFLLIYGERQNVDGKFSQTYIRNCTGEEYFKSENVQWLIEHDYDVSYPPEKVQKMTFDQRMRLANESLISKNKDINGKNIEDPTKAIDDLECELRELGSFEHLIIFTKENIEKLKDRREKAKSELKALDRFAFLRKSQLKTELANLHQDIQNETTMLSEFEDKQRKRESLEHLISELKRQREEMKDLLPWF